jgi:hypothetical protein
LTILEKFEYQRGTLIKMPLIQLLKIDASFVKYKLLNPLVLEIGNSYAQIIQTTLTYAHDKSSGPCDNKD